MKFALFSGSTPDWNPGELVAKLKSQGWDGVEWRVVDQKPSEVPGFWAGNLATFPFTGLEDRIDEMKAVTESAGLAHAAIAGYVPIGERSAVDRAFKLTAATGAGRFRVAMPKTAPGLTYNDLFAQTRKDAAYAAGRARHHGVKALIQIHHGNIVSTASAAMRLLDGLDPDAIGVIHDLGNMSIEGQEGLGTYTPGMEILGPYLAHVHVKNAVWALSAEHADGTVDWAWKWAPLRSGLGDVKAYFRALREVGYDGWVTVENFTTELPLEARIANDLHYLKAAAQLAGYRL